MAAQTLSQFTSELRARNISKPNMYYVEIVAPPIFSSNTKGFVAKDQNLISMFCHTAMTPQSTISTQDNYLEAGTRRKYAYDQDYQNLTLSFYIDQQFAVKRFFDQWKQAIVPQRRNFNYPEQYTAESLNVYILDSNGKATYKYEYSKVFPKSFNTVELSYAPTSGPSTFTVDFVFEEVYYSSLKSGLTEFTSKPDDAPVDTKVAGVGITNPEVKQSSMEDSSWRGRGDKVTGKVMVAANTRQGIKVATEPFSSPKNDDPDMKIKYGDKTVNDQKWTTLKGMTRLDKVIVLPMPQEHTVNTSLKYNDEFASTDLTKLGDMMNNSAAGTASNLWTMAKTSVIAGIVNKVKSGATNEQSLLAEEGKVANPKKEVMYESFGFRTFNFSYQFAPKNEKESQMVSDIIETFRYYALPELMEGKMYYIYPSEFEISFMLGGVDNPHIPKITTSVLKRISVNYMPNSIWSSLPNGAPLSLSISLEFLELELVDRARVYNEKSPITSGY